MNLSLAALSNYLEILVSENKVLCHPSSVDSLPTAAGQEDHVSMGGFSARKALSVVKNVEKGQISKYYTLLSLLTSLQRKVKTIRRVNAH